MGRLLFSQGERGNILWEVRACGTELLLPKSQSTNEFKTLFQLEDLLKLWLAASEQHLVQTTSRRQWFRLTPFNSPLKCFSRDSCMLAWVWEHSWLVASCFFISPVIARPRLSNSTEWYFRHRLLRFSWVELMLFCWLWSSFCMSYVMKAHCEYIQRALIPFKRNTVIISLWYLFFQIWN